MNCVRVKYNIPNLNSNKVNRWIRNINENHKYQRN